MSDDEHYKPPAPPTPAKAPTDAHAQNPQAPPQAPDARTPKPTSAPLTPPAPPPSLTAPQTTPTTAPAAAPQTQTPATMPTPPAAPNDTAAAPAANTAGAKPRSGAATSPEDNALPEDYDPMAAITEKKELEAKKAQEKADKKAAEKAKKNGGAGLKGKLKRAPDDKFTQAIKQSRLQAKTKKRRKKQMKFGIAGGVILVLGALFMYIITPYKGGMNYGICKVFAERNLTFPSTMKVMATEEFRTSIRIWYMMIDSFGNERMQPIQCYFTEGDYGYLKLTKVKIRRRELEQSVIDGFNKTIPVIYAFPPNLEIPYPDTQTLQNLHYEVNRYRRPIL